MTNTQNLILADTQIRQIIRRIAFEIYENNFNEKSIVLVGIYDKGYFLAEAILKELETIVDHVKLSLVRLDINKENPLASEVKLDVPPDDLKNKSIVIVDDVLNSGRTITYGLKALLEANVKKVETAVLVNRSHKSFPISAKYMGYELSTTIDDHVEVKLGKEAAVYLY